MNSHELHSEIGSLAIPKIPWVKRTCLLCGTKRVAAENTFSKNVKL